MKLKKVSSTEIVPTAPFDFDSTFHKPEHFTSGDNYWEPGVRWQTWNWQEKQLGLKFVNAGLTGQPGIIVENSLYGAHRVNIDIPAWSIDHS